MNAVDGQMKNNKQSKIALLSIDLYESIALSANHITTNNSIDHILYLSITQAVVG